MTMNGLQGRSQEFVRGGTTEEVWGTEVLLRVQEQSPRGGLGRSPQKPEKNANFQLRRPPGTYATDGLFQNTCAFVIHHKNEDIDRIRRKCSLGTQVSEFRQYKIYADIQSRGLSEDETSKDNDWSKTAIFQCIRLLYLRSKL